MYSKFDYIRNFMNNLPRSLEFNSQLLTTTLNSTLAAIMNSWLTATILFGSFCLFFTAIFNQVLFLLLLILKNIIYHSIVSHNRITKNIFIWRILINDPSQGIYENYRIFRLSWRVTNTISLYKLTSDLLFFIYFKLVMKLMKFC